VTTTHRVVIVEQIIHSVESVRSLLSDPERHFMDELDAPINVGVSQEDVPMPYNERLEHAVLRRGETHSRCEESLLTRERG